MNFQILHVYQRLIIKIHFSEILLIYIDEYKRNYPKISFNQSIQNEVYINFDQSYIDIILNNLFKNSIEALNKSSNPIIEISLNKMKIIFYYLSLIMVLVMMVMLKI